MIDQLPPTLTRVDLAAQRSAEYIRADVVATQLAERDCQLAELKAMQWTAIAEKFIQLDEHIMETAASVGCDSVASMAQKIVQARDDIAQCNAKLESIRAVVRRWIDISGPDHGSSMVEIIQILYPPPLPTGDIKEPNHV